ncbi:MAG: hypothetical protein ACKOFA_01015 [Rhodoluna sp.]
MNLKKSGLMGFVTSLLVIGSSIVGLGVGAAQAASSPISVTFESDDSSGASLGGSADFGGNASSVITSTVGANTSKVGKIVNGGDCWSGTTFLIKSSGWQLISDVSKTISADVYSTVAISNVKMKVEGGAGDPAREVDVAHNGNGWQRLTWDLGTGAPFAPGNYIKASIFVGFSCGTSSVHPAETLFDNVSFPGATSPDVIVPRTTPSVLANFESSDTSGYAFIGFGGSSGSVDTAPDGGSVGSTKAFKLAEGGDCWAGTTFLKRGAKESLISSGNPVVKANIYAPAAGKVIRLKLENSANGAQYKEVDVTSVQGWKTYSFDFTGFNANVDYNMASIFANFTCGGGNKAADAWYVDDVSFNGAVGANLETPVTPVLVNFESSDSSGYAFTPFGGNVVAKDSSAPTGGSVGSTSAMKITNAGDCWAGVTFLSSSSSLLASGKTTVKANIYAPAAGKVIKLKLEDSTNGGINKEVDVTSVQGWNTYSFDFSSFNSALKYNMASICVDFACAAGSPAKDGSSWFVDDIAFLGAAGAALAGSGGGNTEPTPFTGNAVIRLVGADATNTFNRQADADFFVSQNWYRGGLRVMTKQVPVGSTQRLTWIVSNAADGTPLANTKVKFVFGKEYSGSNAKVNIGSASSTGAQKIVEGVTAADGTVSFDLVNTDVAADAADNPGTNLGGNYTGKHLYSQVTAWVSNQNQDSIDLVDLVYFKPADAPVIKTIVTRVTGINETNAYVGTCEGWCQYYAAGLRYFERGIEVGTTTTLNWTVTDTDGNPYANKSVKLLLGKTYSGSNAKVSVNGTAFPGSGDEKVIPLTTDANGLLSFEVVNSNFNADADPYQAANVKNPRTGKHLFVQIAVVGEKGNQDVLDIIDLNYYQPQGAGPATVYNVRLADWNSSNSFDGTRVWGDGGLGSWFDQYTGYFAKYVAAGSTFNLRYKVTNVATGALAPNGTVVTLQLGTAWSGSNAKFTVNGVSVDGKTKWGGNGQLDQATTTATVSNGFITVPVTALDPVLDATENPGSSTANPDSLNPLFMQVKVKVEGNAVTRQDWVNIIATKPVAAPAITGVSATTGKKGQAIDIVGTNLGDALGSTVTLFTAATSKTAAVTTPVTVLSVNSTGTRLTVSSPALTQKGYFKVANSGGSATAAATFSASATTTAKPTITLTSSLVKEVGSTFTLSGSNLASASAIAIGGVSASFTIVNATTVVVTVPENVVSGSTISATNLGGTVTTSKFVYQAAVVSDYTKSARVGQNVTITGKNLKATSVVFGGNKSGKIVSSSATSLTVTVPTGALSGAIKVTTGAGSVFTESFTVVPPAPTVSSFTPTTGKKGVALVSVKGTNLTGATVTLGSVQVTLAAGANSTSFKFIIPANAVTGKITVTTAGGTVSSTNNLVVTN